MSEFDDAYVAWRKQPFPHGSIDELVNDVHGDLAVADTWVAESIILFVEDRTFRPAKVEVLAELGMFRRRAVELLEISDEDDTQLLNSYIDYFDRLARVYTAFLARGSQNP